jgi:hypothetical protein
MSSVRGQQTSFRNWKVLLGETDPAPAIPLKRPPKTPGARLTRHFTFTSSIRRVERL